MQTFTLFFEAIVLCRMQLQIILSDVSKKKNPTFKLYPFAQRLIFFKKKESACIDDMIMISCLVTAQESICVHLSVGFPVFL